MVDLTKAETPDYIIKIREQNTLPSIAAKVISERCWDNSIPVDPWSIARKLYFEILEAELVEGISGIVIDATEVPSILKGLSEKRTIILNKEYDKKEQSSVVSHLLAHWIYESNTTDNYIHAEQKQEEHINKDVFTRNLLMPRKQFDYWKTKLINQESSVEEAYRSLTEVFMVQEQRIKERIKYSYMDFTTEEHWLTDFNN